MAFNDQRSLAQFAYSFCVPVNLSVALVWLLLCGCAERHEATVSGVADLDGVPLETGMVTFHPSGGGPAAYGVLTDGGRYEIKTGDKRGLPPGKYHITVKATEAYESKSPGGTPGIPKTLSPARYGNAQTTDLIETVKSGANEINLSLTTASAEQAGDR